MLYTIVSLASFLIRAFLCYLTIDRIPILKNPFANCILLQIISLYTVLMLISRNIVGIFYNKGEAPVLGAILYFFIYVIVLGIIYIIMLLLTKIGVLPL